MNNQLVIPEYVLEHIEESAFFWLQRALAIYAPNYSIQQFTDFDDRLEAHIDGLRVAGAEGWKLAEEMLDNEGPEDFFPAAVLAIESVDGRFDDLIERAKNVSDVIPGLISALGWVSAQHLTGRVKALLEDELPLKQMMGLAACAMHRKNPPNLEQFLSSPASKVRSRALRVAGELGRVDLLPQIKNALYDPKVEARFWATWSAILLGDRQIALESMSTNALKSGPRQMKAFQLALMALPPSSGHELLQQLPETPDAGRLRIIGAGYIGLVKYIPWLIEQMKQPQFARIAGEAFVNITGADFNLDQLESLPPEDYEEGPTDDPDDENVELPEDIALPWPDLKKIKSCWQKNQQQFQSDVRYFLGKPVIREHCVHVLKEGFQRQRIMAALHLSLLNPETQLFPTAAPAWRQKRWVEELNN